MRSVRWRVLLPARDRLDVVIENLRARLHHHFQGVNTSFEVRDQHFDRTAGVNLADAADDGREDGRAAVGASPGTPMTRLIMQFTNYLAALTWTKTESSTSISTQAALM